MRDVDNGWLLRICHANMASFFFICVYAHISRGLYYTSYRSPRIGAWVVGTIIFFLMMATRFQENNQWPNCLLINNKKLIYYFISNLSFSKKGTKALCRIGPHNIDILSVLICGLLGDWWGDKIINKGGISIRFNIEQGLNNSAYINHLTYLFFNFQDLRSWKSKVNDWGYSSYLIPKLVKKTELKKNNGNVERFNYRLTLFIFSSLDWVYDSFYAVEKGKKIKKVPIWIEEFITPIGLAHWIMQDGSRQKGQGVNIATHSFTLKECEFLSGILYKKYNLTTTIIKSGYENQWRIAIWKESMPTLVNIIKPYVVDEMKYKLKDYI